MKTKVTLLAIIFILSFFSQGFSQEATTERIPTSFNSLKVGGYYKIILHKGDPKIIIHAKESVAQKIIVEVKQGVLVISNKPIKQKTPISIEVYSDYIEDYEINGAVILKSDEIQKPDNLRIVLGGAATATLKVETNDIAVFLSGASVLNIEGKSQSFDVKAKGAAIIRSSELETEKRTVILSGSAGVLVIDDVKDNDTVFNRSLSSTDNMDEKTTYGVSYDGSVAQAKFLGIHVNIDEDDETGEVQVGTHKWYYDSYGEVSHKRIKPPKFNGHWGGFGLGINGYVNDKLSYELPQEYEFMNLLWQKSVNVDFNIYEQNINLSRNKNIGLITGIGYSIYNYRFTDSYTVMQDSSYFSGLYNRGINVRKSKIVTNYIMIPLLFEIQDNNASPLTKHRWHVNIGAIFGMRVHTHQKTYFDEHNKEYNLVNPVTGEIDAIATSPSYAKSKVHDDFYIRPFKVDASLRVGWGWINLYANLSLTEMFSKNKGPKLYPFNIGIMLVNW